jgi:hypothetical protein
MKSLSVGDRVTLSTDEPFYKTSGGGKFYHYSSVEIAKGMTGRVVQCRDIVGDYKIRFDDLVWPLYVNEECLEDTKKSL